MLKHVKKDIPGFLLLSFLLLLFWLLISASFDWQHLLMGTGISLLLMFFWADVLFTREGGTRFSLKQFLELLVYLAALGVEVIKANLFVAYLVLHPRLPISPGFVTYRLDLKKDLSKALFLNSITLTPGTITVECEGDRLVVHCFTRENAEAVQHWPLYHRMQKLEGGEEVD
jgi:multicomponent Na+:H+ antiporter subunit E